MVSILVLLEILLQQRRIQSLRQRINVSILVLLEILLQLLGGRWFLLPWLGFNPCFIGNPSATLTELENMNCLIWVSILVLLEILLQPFAPEPYLTQLLGFQSLFYWKSFCNKINGNITHSSKICFNPCFIGNPSATKKNIKYTL